MNSKPAPNHNLAAVKKRLADLVERDSGSLIEPGLTLGQIHRKALDLKISTNDLQLSLRWFDFCSDLEDEASYPVTSYAELLTARPLFGQWLEEGMSPLSYFIDPTSGSTSSAIFDAFVRLNNFKLEPAKILGNLSLSEFSNALADMLSIADVGIPYLRELGEALPRLYEKSNWKNLITGQFTDHASFNEKSASNSYPGFPTLILDRFNDNQSLYHEAEDFFFRPDTEPDKKLLPIIEQLHDVRAEVLMESVISHLYEGWNSTYTDKALSDIISRYRVFQIESHRNPMSWAVTMDYLAKKAINVSKDSEQCLWPHTLCKAFFAEINKLDRHISQDDAEAVKRHFYRTPGFLALAEGHGDTLILNASSTDISNVVYSKDFLTHVSAKKRRELIDRNASSVASKIIKELYRNNFSVRQNEIQNFAEGIHPSMLQAVSSEIFQKIEASDVMKRFKSRYNTAVWFQCQCLQGVKHQKKAVAYCKRLPTAELKATAAGYLNLPVHVFNPNDAESEAFLARDLGL